MESSSRLPASSSPSCPSSCEYSGVAELPRVPVPINVLSWETNTWNGTAQFSSPSVPTLPLQVFSNQLLHQVRPDTLHHQHHLPHERADPQTASVPRSPDLWDQQVLSGWRRRWAERGFLLSSPISSPHTDWDVVLQQLFKADPNRHIPHAGSSCPINPNQLQSRV